MRLAYFDCASGASGDMILGALVSCGLDFEFLRDELGKLRLAGYSLSRREVVKGGIAGTHVIVDLDEHDHAHRHLADIEKIIAESSLKEAVKSRGTEIFRRLAQAEASVHHRSVDHIHFHEVGAVDAIVDIVGAVVGLDALGIERIYCSALHVGTGTVQCAHGILPVPAPATAELLKGRPFYSTGVVGELLTPTGAAILTTLAYDFGPMPLMTVDAIGYGAGTRELSIPNLLRVFVGRAGI
ncbi:MAG: nickel pincer cofactor biosynthesis protein LarC [Desulfobacteraceae bacterium]|nr:nickel pincer cofactor biosynthesis protein LarC [Desulfobacteraceae bacterium]